MNCVESGPDQMAEGLRHHTSAMFGGGSGSVGKQIVVAAIACLLKRRKVIFL